MASPTKDGSNDQVLFLLACIKFSENGRPVWEHVAKECGIVTKAAAAKRYERLLKAHNIPLPGRSKDGQPSTPSKKRNKDVAAHGEAEEDDAESPAKKPKSKKKADVKKEVKEEEEADEE